MTLVSVRYSRACSSAASPTCRAYSAYSASILAQEGVAHCRGKLAGFKIPKRVEFRDAIPRTATGKIQKFKLREEFWSGAERQVN